VVLFVSLTMKAFKNLYDFGWCNTGGFTDVADIGCMIAFRCPRAKPVSEYDVPKERGLGVFANLGSKGSALGRRRLS